MSTPEYFARIAGSVNLPLLQARRVVVIGVGMVGSQIAEELAKCGIGHLRLIDHDRLEKVNLSRHALTDDYLGWNKAEGMTVYLAKHVEGLRAEAVPHRIDRSVSEGLLDRWLEDADLIVAATDDHATQRRIGQRALATGVPSIFPALYVEGGGEIIVQLDDQVPCFSCWDEFRPPDAPLRGAQALNILALPIVYISLRICLGLLDPGSPDRRIMRAGNGQPPYQTFGLNRFGTLLSGHLTWRERCPGCGGPPLSGIPESTHTIPTSLPTPVLSTRRQASQSTDANQVVGDVFKLVGSLITNVIGGCIVLALAFVWTWFWSGDFHYMSNPIIWIGLILGLGGAFGEFMRDL